MMPSLSRRTFLKAGLAGSLLLAVAGQVAAAPDEEGRMLRAVAAALLVGALPESGGERERMLDETVQGIRKAVAGLSLPVQKEIVELFSLLTLSPVRRLLAGVNADWGEARVVDVSAFLEQWRNSRFALLQSAYAALHDLTFGAWYARPERWDAIGYPGPPEVF